MKLKICRYIDILIQIVFIYGYGVVLPLYFQNKYFDMLEAKYSCYKIIGFILIILITINVIIKTLSQEFHPKPGLLNIAMIIFLISCTMTTMLSSVPKYSFTGNQGFYVGLQTILIAIISILYISSLSQLKTICFIPVVITSCLIYILTIFHSAEIDILNMHQQILPAAYHKYLSTMGNINWFGGYLCLTVPLYFCMYLKTGSFFILIASILGISNCLLLGSDGLYIGILTSLFILIFVILKDKTSTKRTATIAFTIITEILLIKNSPQFTNHLETMEGINSLLISNSSIVLFSAVFLMLVVLYFFLNEKYTSAIASVFDTLLLISAIVITFAAIKESGIFFGNNRLIIWKESIDAYINHFSLKQKLFGNGLEMCRNIYQLLSSYSGQLVTTSHSEPIQLLVTAGISGFTAYILFIVAYVITFIKNRLYENHLKLSITIALMAYLGQSLTISTTIPNLAFMSVLLCLFMQNN